VSKFYPSSGNEKILALNNISIKFNSKSLSLVVGPLGSGKSTLLRVAGFLDSPSSGSVIFNDQDWTNPTPRERSHLIRYEVGFVPPYPNLLPYLTILENIMLPMIKKNQSRALELLKDLGVKNIDSYPNQISVEEQQRASIARAMINSPQLLLVDEPTSSLTESGAINIMELLKDLKKEFTIMVFTDNIKLFKYSDTVFKLNHGVLE